MKKNIFNKKWMLTLGSVSAIVAPVATIVSCGSSVDEHKTAEAIKQRELWSKSGSILTTAYQELLISKLTSQSTANEAEFGKLDKFDYQTLMQNPKFKTFLIDYVAWNIYNSKDYLSTLGNALMKQTIFGTKDSKGARDFTETSTTNSIAADNANIEAKKGTISIIKNGETTPTYYTYKNVGDSKLNGDKYTDADKGWYISDESGKVSSPETKVTLPTALFIVEDKMPELQYTDVMLNTEMGMFKHFLASSNIDTTKEEFFNNKFSDTYVEEQLRGKSYFDVAFETMWEKNVNNFKNSVYQYMISSFYLNTNKTNWTKVFIEPANATKRIVGLQANVDVDHFMLGKLLLDSKIAFNWKASLDDVTSKTFIGDEKTASELDDMLKFTAPGDASNGLIANLESRTAQQTRMPSFLLGKPNTDANDNFWKRIANNKDLIGFAGLGSPSISMDDEKIKQVTSVATYDEKYIGYVNTEKKEVLNETDASAKIKLTTPESPKVDITKTAILMPIWENGILKIDYFKEPTDANHGSEFETLKRILISKNAAALYQEAIDYYISKENIEFGLDDSDHKGGIRLDIKNEELRTIAIDNLGLNFINKPE